jgi:hypothetical protein
MSLHQRAGRRRKEGAPSEAGQAGRAYANGWRCTPVPPRPAWAWPPAGERFWAQAEVRRRGSWRSPSRECTRLIDRRQRMLSALVASVRGCIRDDPRGDALRSRPGAARGAPARAGRRLRGEARPLRQGRAAAAHATDGSVDQQAHNRGGCSLNSTTKCLIRLDRLRARAVETSAAPAEHSAPQTNTRRLTVRPRCAGQRITFVPFARSSIPSE